jgi:trehalose/maltose transport system permease protein
MQGQEKKMTDLPSPQTNQESAAQGAEYTSGRLSAFIFGGLFVLIGISAIIWLFLSVIRDPAILMAVEGIPTTDGQPPSFIMAFLTQFGIVLPVLVVGLGLASVWLGVRLLTRDILAARWAQIVLLWLIVAAAIAALVNGVRLGADLLAQTQQQAEPLDQGRLMPLFLLLCAIGLFSVLLVWLNRNIERVFVGKEQLTSREVRNAWNLLIPTLAVFVLVAARPLEQTFIRSLTDKRFAGQEVPNFVGLENYRNLLGIRLDIVDCRTDEATGQCDLARDGSIRWETIDRELLKDGFRTVWTIPVPFGPTRSAVAISGLDEDFMESIGTTLLFTVVSVALELLIALFMALTVNSAFRGRGLMRAVMLIPWAIPTVISARLWELMLKDTSAGIINRVLMDVRIVDAPQAWLSAVTLQLPAAIMVDVWKTAPFMALLLLAGLQTIPSDLYEAASVDGASRVQQFFSITLPLLRPTIAVALVFRTLDALRVFDLFNVLFGRQQLSMATYNYETLVNNQQDGYASAISMIIFVVISIFAITYVRLLNVETE